MARITLDKADAAVLQVHFDAAAACAHVAGRVLDLIGNARRGVDLLAGRPVITPNFEQTHSGQGSFGLSASSSEVPLPRSSRAAAFVPLTPLFDSGSGRVSSTGRPASR